LDIHVTGDTWITINPPCSSDASLPFEDSELVKSQFFFKATSHGNARLATTDDGDWVVCIAVGIVAIVLSDSVSKELLIVSMKACEA
jgi:hypothetical protein